MKILKTLLLLIIFCASSLVGFGQEEKRENPYYGFDNNLQYILREYESFLNSSKARLDTAELERTIQWKKHSISIEGNNVSNYKIKIGVFCKNSIPNIESYGELMRHFHSDNYYSYDLKVRLDKLLKLQKIDGVFSIVASQRVFENLPQRTSQSPPKSKHKNEK